MMLLLCHLFAGPYTAVVADLLRNGEVSWRSVLFFFNIISAGLAPEHNTDYKEVRLPPGNYYKSLL